MSLELFSCFSLPRCYNLMCTVKVTYYYILKIERKGWRNSFINDTFKNIYSDSSTSESEGSSVSPIKNKHPDEDTVEAEGHEVKRLRFDKESEVREMASQTSSSEISSVMVEETESPSSSQNKDKESSCTRQHCTEEEEEEDEEEEEGI